jgi:hypothetical protein
MSPKTSFRTVLATPEITSYRQAVRVMITRSVAIIVTMGALYAFLPFDGKNWWVGAIIGGLAVAAVIPLTAYRISLLKRSEQPVVDAVEALVLLLGLLIFGFAAVYLTINRGGGEVNGLNTRLDSIYFTVTTLSTVGYGDITAVSQRARAVATIQMLFDLAFIAFAVRVVAGVARERHQARQQPPSE